MEEKSENPNRRTNKPLMEKRRRARINTCLGELKTLVLMALNKDNSQFSKLEKADILEMAVKYLRHVQNASIATHAMDSVAVTKYRLGYGECAREVLNCLGQSETVADDLRRRVSDHLSKCLYGVHSVELSSIETHTIPNYRRETRYFESRDIGTVNFNRHHYIPSAHLTVMDTTAPSYTPRQILNSRTSYSSSKFAQKTHFPSGQNRTLKVEPERNRQIDSGKSSLQPRHHTSKSKPTSTVSSPESTTATANTICVSDSPSQRNLHKQGGEINKKRKAMDCCQIDSDTETNSGADSSKHRRLADDKEASGDKSDDESVWRPW